MAKVLVTGGAGFLGSHIADALSDAGHEVTILDRVASRWLRADQKFIEGDITDIASVEAAVTGQEYVYHLAALADLNAAKTRPLDTVHLNILGTVHLLDASARLGVKRFIFGSSVYVFSREGGFYRCSKQACEQYVEEYQNRYELDFTILRYGSLYGTRTDMANGVYRLLYRYMTENEMSYPGTSKDRREYIHVLDAAKLSAAILEQENSINQTYVITGNDHLAIADLFKMFSEILGRDIPLDFVGDRNPASGHYSMTPYAFTPKLGRKMVSNEYVDMGQGLLELIAEIHHSQSMDSE